MDESDNVRDVTCHTEMCAPVICVTYNHQSSANSVFSQAYQTEAGPIKVGYFGSSIPELGKLGFILWIHYQEPS